MKYSLEIIIDLPRDRVIELFDNMENIYKWQPTLQSHEMLAGVPGEVGAKMKLIYLERKRKVELIETITEKNLPHEFSGTYHAKGMYNEIQNIFEDLGDGRTKWISHQVFHLSGFLKIMGWLMPGAFKKHSRKMHEQFKIFAENEAG